MPDERTQFLAVALGVKPEWVPPQLPIPETKEEWDEAVLRFLLTKLAASEVPARLDAATARRRYPDADARIPRLVG